MHKPVPGLFLAAMSWNVSRTGGVVDRHVATVMCCPCRVLVVPRLLLFWLMKAFFDLISVNTGYEGSLWAW